MNRSSVIGIAAVGLAAVMPVSAQAAEWFDGRVKVDLNMMQGFQQMDADENAFFAVNDDPAAGFQRTRFNMSLTIEFTDWLSGFIDIAEEPNDFGANGFAIEDDLSFLDISLLDALDSSLAENNVLIVRVGNPVPVLFQYRGFSDGAQTQSNPLIGNSPYDMVTAETGMQIIGHHDLGAGDMFSGIDWDVVIGNPTFFEDFSDGRGWHFTAKASIDVLSGDNPLGQLSIGGGWSHLDSSDQLLPGNGSSQARPSGGTEMVFGDGENINFPGKGAFNAGARDTHAGLLPGIEMDLYQFNVMYKPSFVPLRLIGFYGGGQDEFSFVNAAGIQTVRSQAADSAGNLGEFVNEQISKIEAWGIEATYDIIPDRLYIAGRYTVVSNESDLGNRVLFTGDLERIQIGAGFWLADNTLLKVEYIHQSEDAGSPGQIGDDWQGGLFELSAAF